MNDVSRLRERKKGLKCLNVSFARLKKLFKDKKTHFTRITSVEQCFSFATLGRDTFDYEEQVLSFTLANKMKIVAIQLLICSFACLGTN